MPNYKEVDGVRYQVVNNTFLGSNLIPVDAGGSLPEVDGSDNGKVLTVVAGEWGAAAVPKELPSVTGNAGKVLTVNSGATGTEWKDAPSGLPAVTIDDAGDVLTVNSSGQWAKAAPASGGGYALYGLYYLSGEIAQNIAYGSIGVGHITSIESLTGDPLDTAVLQDGDFFVPVLEDYSQISLPPIKKDLYYYEIEGSALGSLSITVLNTIDQYTIEQGASFTIYALCSRELPLSEQE